MFTHKPGESCFELGLLESLLSDSLQSLGIHSSTYVHSELGIWAADIYAIARVRSRFPTCCWSSESKTALACYRNICDYRILAWLTRGPIGKKELEELRDKQNGLWDWMTLYIPSGSPRHFQEFGYRPSIRESDQFAMLKNMMSHFRLLIECGYPIDELILDGRGTPKTVWLLFLETARSWQTLDEQGYLDLTSLCGYLLCVASETETTEQYRYFLTGKGLPEIYEDGSPAETSTFRTTLLHESVLADWYPAVEALTLQGFNVNALDGNGKTPIQLALESKDSKDPQEIHTLRIIALLEQNKSIWDRSDFSSRRLESSLPLGWKTEILPEESGDRSLFFEKHFGGLTFKRPTFSLFQDQRLALGFRKVSLPGQTYYLDLIRFFQKDTTSPSQIAQPTRIFTLQWYINDIRATNKELRKPGLPSFQNIFYTPTSYHQHDSPWVRWPALCLRIIWVLLSSSYFNLLLTLLPLSIIAGILNWSPGASIGVSIGAIIPLSKMLRFAMAELFGKWNSRDSGLVRRVDDLDCLIELFVGVP